MLIKQNKNDKNLTAKMYFFYSKKLMGKVGGWGTKFSIYHLLLGHIDKLSKDISLVKAGHEGLV